MQKSLIIVIDEFSSRVLNYSNTTLYEYGDVTGYYAERFWTSDTYHKYEEVGKTEDIFYEVTPDNENFDNAQIVEDLGFFIGLHTKKINTKLAQYISSNLLKINEL